jgi:hypothetical protein
VADTQTIIEAEIVEDGDDEHDVVRSQGGSESLRALAIREQASVARWRAAASAVVGLAFFGFCSTCAYVTCGG